MRSRINFVLLFAAVLIAVVATVCFTIQGGFGGGHGDLDYVLFILGLPWSLVPWPAPIMKVDFVWVVLMPFMLNVVTILIGGFIVRTFVSRRNSAAEST